MLQGQKGMLERWRHGATLITISIGMRVHVLVVVVIPIVVTLTTGIMSVCLRVSRERLCMFLSYLSDDICDNICGAYK